MPSIYKLVRSQKILAAEILLLYYHHHRYYHYNCTITTIQLFRTFLFLWSSTRNETVTEHRCASSHPDLWIPLGKREGLEMKSNHPAHPTLKRYLVRRSRTCCLRLGMVARASTMVQAACRAACVAGVKSTCGVWTEAPAQLTASHQAPQGTVNCHPSRGSPLSTSLGKVKGKNHQLTQDQTAAGW